MRPALGGALVLVAVVTGTASARQAAPIRDNSFLVEEAYNQEGGVVQHVLLLQRPRHGAGWVLGVTQEWPVPGQRHQLGFTVPIVRPDGLGPGTVTGVGDVLVNYRFQALGQEAGRLWLAPRMSLVIPSGAWRHGRGEGSAGLQVALPVSWQAAPTLAAHLNAALSVLPGARNAVGDRASLASLGGGASVVWLPHPSVNLLAEMVVEDGAEVRDDGAVSRQAAVFLAPGVRWAHNLPKGVQVVPGVAYALGLGRANRESAFLLYLSLEHRFRR